jgi:hypothetical protein
MLRLGHRASKDVDIFFTDPQYLPHLSPRLGGEAIWQCSNYDEAGHYLKLRYPEGEIDFIVTADVSSIPPEPLTLSVSEYDLEPLPTVQLDHPVEIVLKKLHYRGGDLKARDLFDLCVVQCAYPRLLQASLHRIADRKPMLEARLDRMRPDFFRAEIEQLDISVTWRPLAAETWERAAALIRSVGTATS